jgi:dephospho-CoA kinase
MMGAWQDKFVIGLTGNIATGKSVVRKMLEHLGAYGIDADALGHRAIVKGAPGYEPIVDTFGKWILASDGQVDRKKLGRVVFSDPEAMQTLENIVHPLVLQAVDILIRRAKQDVVVVEAIKLIEAGLAEKCDSVWATMAPQELQLARLMQKRNMKEFTARQRISVQSLQEKKAAAAQVVIRNSGSFDDTWHQVTSAWKNLVPSTEDALLSEAATEAGEAKVMRARPQEADEVASAITKLSAGIRTITRDDVMASFGDKAFLLLRVNNEVRALVGWKVENLVARTDDVYIDKNLPFLDSLRIMMTEVEKASRELQCEISLLFLPMKLANSESALNSLGYNRRTVGSLGVRAWEDAALESMPEGSVMLFKQLRQDRVLKPV